MYSASLTTMPPVSISSKRLAFVSGDAVDAVARDAGLVAHDGAALAGDAIEEGGFADVRPSNDYDRR